MKRTIFVLLAAVLMAVGVANEVKAAGTAAGDSVTAGYFATTDTVPQKSGRLSIAYVSSSLPADTQYKGPAATVTRTVDTGFDLAALNSPSDVNTAKARDTVSYAYVITNRGNATQTMDVSAVFANSGTETNWGSSAYKVFNDANENGVWEAGDVVITTVTLAADAMDTIVVVVLVPVNAVEDDSSGTRFFVTDRSTIVSPSTTGDLWQSGGPISGDDLYDTQYDTVVTRIVGPNVRVTKTQALQTGRARPGDTIVYNITFDNDGGDSASNAVLYDAISQNATFIPNTADSAYLPTNGYVTSFDDTYSATNFNDTGNTSAKVIRWTLTSPIGATGGDDRATVDLTGVNDSGRVEFRVRIN